MAYIYKTKDGRKLRFDVLENHIPPDRKGFVVHEIVALIDDKMMGYINLSYIPHEEWERVYPTAWHFSQILLPDGRLLGLSDDEMKDAEVLWYNLVGKYMSNGAQKKISAEQRKKDLDGELKEYERIKKQLYNFYVDKPIVDFVRSMEQRNHVGLNLYKYAARWLAEKGMALYASDIESESAKKLWAKLEKLKSVPTSREPKTKIYSNDVVRRKIDYREKGKSEV